MSLQSGPDSASGCAQRLPIPARMATKKKTTEKQNNTKKKLKQALSRQALKCCKQSPHHLTTQSFVHDCYFCHFWLNPMRHVGENALGAVRYTVRHTVLLLPLFAAGPIPDALIYLHFLAAFEFFSLGYRKGSITPHEGLCSNNVSFQCCDHCLSQAHTFVLFLFFLFFFCFF